MSSFQVGGHANGIILLPDPPPPPAPLAAVGADPARTPVPAEQVAAVCTQPHGQRRLLKRTTWGEVSFYSVCQSLARGQSPESSHAEEMQLPHAPVSPTTRNAAAALVEIQPPFYGAFPLVPSPSYPPPQDEAVRSAVRCLEQNPATGSSAAEHTWGLLLGNVAAGMHWPHTIDVKLGHVLFDDRPGRAKSDKVERMKVAAATSTSSSHGVRLTGWQHWLSSRGSEEDASAPNRERSLHPVDKTFGKRIDHSGLAVGLRIFLGCASAEDEAHFASITQRAPTDGTCDPHRAPPWVVALLLEQEILPQLEHMVLVVSETEMRFRGTSLLLACEGDTGLLHQWASEQSPCSPLRWEGPPIAVCRLIDFAHSYLAPGQGPDEGLLCGLRTLITTFRTILAELRSRDRE